MSLIVSCRQAPSFHISLPNLPKAELQDDSTGGKVPKPTEAKPPGHVEDGLHAVHTAVEDKEEERHHVAHLHYEDAPEVSPSDGQDSINITYSGKCGSLALVSP